MFKFLLKNKCDITQKDQKGDTIKDNIQRYMFRDLEMVNTYYKYENRFLIEKSF